MNSSDDNIFCDLPDLVKIKNRIINSDSTDTKFYFLILSGSFNPIHTEHLHMLNITKSFLGNKNDIVVAGFMVPSGNKYLRDKLGTDAYSLAQRIALCRIAIKQYEWMCVAIKDELSSKWACRYIGHQLQQYCRDVLHNRELTGIEIMGSDSFIRVFSKILDGGSEYKNDGERTVICLLRPGPGSETMQKHIEVIMIPRLALLSIEVLLPDPAFFDSPLKEISSTDIRKLISQHQWEVLEKKEWLPTEVLNCLKPGGKIFK